MKVQVLDGGRSGAHPGLGRARSGRAGARSPHPREGRQAGEECLLVGMTFADP